MLITEYNLFKRLLKKKPIDDPIPHESKEEKTIYQSLRLPDEKLYQPYDKKMISSSSTQYPVDRSVRDITRKEYDAMVKKFNIIRKYIEDGKFSFYKGYFNDVNCSYHHGGGSSGLVVVLYNSKQTTYPMWTIKGMSDDYYFATLTYLHQITRIEVKDFYLCDTMDGVFQLLLNTRIGKTGQV